MSATRRELLEERWQVLTTRPQRFKGEAGISSVTSKRYDRINETLEELATMLVDEVHFDEYDNGQSTGLASVTEDIWDEIKERLLAWAERVGEAREQRRREAAA